MTDVQMAIEAAKLLGRWTLIAEKHANGCSCCPGLGDVTMEQVEGNVAAWLKQRHPFLHENGVTALLKDCIARKAGPPAGEGIETLFRDLAEALDHLEQVQRGF